MNLSTAPRKAEDLYLVPNPGLPHWQHHLVIMRNAFQRVLAPSVDKLVWRSEGGRAPQNKQIDPNRLDTFLDTAWCAVRA
jgi:hypothetical protein